MCRTVYSLRTLPSFRPFSLIRLPLCFSSKIPPLRDHPPPICEFINPSVKSSQNLLIKERRGDGTEVWPPFRFFLLQQS